MSRCALFQVIRRSMRLAQVSNQTGLSPQEIVELRAQARGARAARAIVARRNLESVAVA